MKKTVKPNNICQTSKKERQKKFNKIKDSLHRGLGNKIFTGIGEKKPLICDICKKRVHHIYGKLLPDKMIDTCEVCKNRRCAMCEKEDMLFLVHIDKYLTEYWCEECIKKEEKIWKTK